MNSFDILLNNEEHFRIGFGGGCLILECKKCKKDIGAEEVDFPGSQEQQKEPRAKLEIKKQNHKC